LLNLIQTTRANEEKILSYWFLHLKKSLNFAFYCLGNVLKELVEPAGAVIFSKLFSLGDPSISALELWGAEYQESNALLCSAADVPTLQAIAERERCPIDVVGSVTSTGKV